MTSIFGHRPPVPSVETPSLPRLAAGQQIEATVLGPTRRGVSVLIGQERLQLETSSRLANATTLVLQVASSSASETRRQVHIVASDGRSLAKPIPADLTSGSEPEASTPGAIVKKGLVRVVGQPVTPDGKALGPSVTLHLETAAPGIERRAATERSVVKGTTTMPADVPNSSKMVDRQAGPDQAWQRQSGFRDMPAGTERGPDRSTGSPPPQSAIVVGAMSKGIGSLAAPSSSSVVPNPSSPTLVKGVLGELRSDATPFEPRSNAAAPVLAKGIEPPSIEKADSSAISSYRRGVDSTALKNPNVSLEMPRSMEPGLGLDRNRPMMATLVEKTGANGVILKADDRYFKVEQSIDLPLGASLQVTLASDMPVLATPSHQRGSQGVETPLAKLIEILDDIDRAGRQAVEAGQSSSPRQLPSPDKNLAARFLALLSNGDGELPHHQQSPSSSGQIDSTTMRREQIQALARELGALASEPLAEGWKSMPLPLGSDPSHAVSCCFRQQFLDPDEGGADDEVERPETQRAVFDVSFSQLGRCQIDALCQERRFDLLIRSERPLPDQDRQDIAMLFSSACDVSGLHGEIGFRTGDFFEPARSSMVSSNDFQT